MKSITLNNLERYFFSTHGFSKLQLIQPFRISLPCIIAFTDACLIFFARWMLLSFQSVLLNLEPKIHICCFAPEDFFLHFMHEANLRKQLSCYARSLFQFNLFNFTSCERSLALFGKSHSL